MKKLLAFLVIFAAGLGVLRLVQGPPPVGAGDGVERAPFVPDPGMDAPGLTPGGELVVRQLLPGDDVGRRPVRMVLRAADSGPGAEPDALVFDDVEVRYLDPATEEERLRLDAGLARARRAPAQAELDLAIVPRIELEDAAVTLWDGAPIVPLAARIPRVVLDLDARTLASDDAVEIEGGADAESGLHGGGRGLFVDQAERLLRLERDARLELSGLRPGAMLSSEGPLVVRPDPTGPEGGILVEASGGARLLPGRAPDDAEDAPAGDAPELDADVVVLRGARGRDGALAFRSIEAEGGVRYVHGGHVLEGGRLVVEIEDGAPTSARLSRGPRATLDLDHGLAGLSLPALPGEGRRTAVVESEGDLQLIWDGPLLRVEADAPAKVVGAGCELVSDGPLTGSLDPDADTATFQGTGGVRLSRAGAVLATDRLAVDLARLADGGTRVVAVADGRPLITGKSAGGRDYVLTAEGALRFVQEGETWTIPSAEHVELTVLGEDGFRARADRVESFDPEAVALRASGGVQIESAQGTASGETLNVTGPESFTLEGAPERKAVFENVEGRAEAARVTGEGDAVTLAGDVAARFTPSVRAGERYELACAELELQRSLTEEPDALVRRFRVEALGVTEASLLSPTDELELACAELDAAFQETLELDGRLRERGSTLAARGVERAEVSRAASKVDVRLACTTLDAWRTEVAQPDGAPPLTDGLATAAGGVVFDGRAGEVPFHGVAERVTVDGEGEMHAHAKEGERVYLEGELPSNRRPFELEAEWVRASPHDLEAHQPQILVRRMQEGAGEDVLDVRARADHMTSAETWIEFEGAVHVEGVTEQAVPWRVEAGRVRFEGRLADPASPEPSDVSKMIAAEGVRLTLPRSALRATGETLTAARLSGLMRLEGVPARFESPTLVQESDWIEIDANLGMVVGTGRIRYRPPDDDESSQDDAQAGTSPWTVDALSSRTLVEPDHFVHVLQEPRIVYEGAELQVFLPVLPTNKVEVTASWAAFWVDRSELDALSESLDGDDAPAEAAPQEPPPPEPKGFFGRIREFGVLSEVYLEGPVEITIQGQPNVTASAVYLDVVSGNGWLADVIFTIDGETVGRDFGKVKISADWLRQSNDDSFYADEATVSLCEFEEPHVEITTGDLRIAPNVHDPRHYDIRLKDNRIRMFGLFTLPLPSIDFSTNERGNPILASLKLGNSARFGSFVSAGFARPAEGAANFFRKLLGRPRLNVDLPDLDTPDVDVDAQYHVDASWLGSRGVLLDFGFDVEAEDQFSWLTELGGVPDSDEDKGYIRVPEDDRDRLRAWLRSTGRYWFTERTWLDLVATYQSDAGVQSEFFESEFTRYELQESYLRLRGAQGSNYYSAAVTGRLNDFFSSVDEQPSLSAWHGRGELLALGRASLVYSAEAHAAYLARRESDGGYASPFGLPPVFADGLGEREVARFDTTHRLEAPTPLGVHGLRATPFVLGRFTAWSEDELDGDQPLRGFAQAGLRVAMPLWKEAEGGGVHQLVPYAEVREDVLLEEDGGDPVPFDEVEAPLEGRFLDVGVRGRVRATGAMPLLDLDLRASKVENVPDAAFDGWVELGVFGRVSTELFDMPVQLTHDARYDFEEGDTLYSRFAVGVRPRDDLALEAAHYRGLDLDREPLFEAASIVGVYTWTPKWEFEGRQTFSLLEDGERLGSGVILRRYGHDLVFEIEASYRQGEGSSFGINVRPLFNFDRPDVGELTF